MGDRRSFAVASAHPLSTEAGLEILRQGGNAYDAVLAVSAALPVVQPHMNGLGSDFFAVVQDGPPVAVNASGPAGKNAGPEVFQRLHRRRIPTRGPFSAITVPGMIAAWSFFGERGRFPWTRSLAPAIRLATRGFPASPSLARAVNAIRWADPDLRALYRGVRSGATVRPSRIGTTLRKIANDEGRSFYHGEIARAICRDLHRKGGLLEPSDFEEFRITVLPPLRVRYRGYSVMTNPPPSQGATALIWLNLLSRTDLSSMSEGEYVAALERTMRIAYGYRARFIGDPDQLPFPKRFLAPSAVFREAPVPTGGREGRSDTSAFSVYDGEVGVSAIQSNYMGFGSGVSIRGTGINLNNRGCYFSLDPSHPNALAPRKRTFHTLMATVATGPRRVFLGSMGGDVQPQVNVQVLTRHLDRGLPISTAISAPRFAWPATIYGSAPIYRERGLPLPRARLLSDDLSAFGHAQAISVGEEVEVGVDPRGDGLLPIPS